MCIHMCVCVLMHVCVCTSQVPIFTAPSYQQPPVDGVGVCVCVCVFVCVSLSVCVCVPVQPHTEEIRLKIFVSPDLSVFLIDLLSTGTPFTHVKICLKFWGLLRKSV